jgi:hypothetical protein
VLDDNAADLLMVRCPLPPPAQWDEVLTARALLLRRRGLSPQLFLPAAPLRAPPDLRVRDGLPFLLIILLVNPLKPFVFCHAG